MNGVMLDDFCHRLVNEGTPKGRLHPTDIAREFVDFFGLSTFPRMDEIKAILDNAGVGSVVGSSEVGGLRGYHTGTKNGRYLIRYDAADGNGAQEHTVLHETYEIVRERLRDLHPKVGLPQDRALCRQADRFAAAALMQPHLFSLFAQTAGFDVVALQRTYGAPTPR